MFIVYHYEKPRKSYQLLRYIQQQVPLKHLCAAWQLNAKDFKLLGYWIDPQQQIIVCGYSCALPHNDVYFIANTVMKWGMYDDPKLAGAMLATFNVDDNWDKGSVGLFTHIRKLIGGGLFTEAQISLYANDPAWVGLIPSAEVSYLQTIPAGDVFRYNQAFDKALLVNAQLRDVLKSLRKSSGSEV